MQAPELHIIKNVQLQSANRRCITITTPDAYRRESSAKYLL